MGTRRPLDRSPYFVEPNEHLDRVLSRPQLAGIGISGCVGIGVFVTSGGLITTSGSLGGPLSYAIAGAVAACALYSLTEMVAARPLTGALIDLPHKFLDPAFGFAVACSYTIGNICSMVTLTAHSAELTALLKDKPVPHTTGVEVAINVAFIALTALTHCLGVKLYGRIERIIMWFKLSLFVLVCILMIIINAGGAGPREGSFRANYTSHAFPRGWKPTGFDSTANISLSTTGVADDHFGIAGPGGSLFGFLTAVSMAMFSCMGGEMVAMTAGEAKEPWKDVPIVMSFVYLVPLSLYPLTLMSGAANVNYADHHLPRTWANERGALTLSPFVVAVQSSSLHGLPKVLNLFFIISAYTSANTELYVASRSFFMLSQQYLPSKFANVFGRTNNGKTPLAAILLCASLGFLSLTSLSKYAYSQPRTTLSSVFTGSLACVYICICFTFLNFKAGLDRLAKQGILSRNDPLYISRLFKSRWQPLAAYVGIVGFSFVVIWSGIPPLFILGSRSSLTSSGGLKSNVALAFDVIGAYIGLILFVTFYLAYKYIEPRTARVDIRELTPDDYVLPDIASIELEDDTPSSRRSSDPASTQLGTDAIELEAGRHHSNTLEHDNAPFYDQYEGHMQLTQDMLEDLHAEEARRIERKRLTDILEKRPVRMGRGFWRELWSFVVVDKV